MKQDVQEQVKIGLEPHKSEVFHLFDSNTLW